MGRLDSISPQKARLTVYAFCKFLACMDPAFG